MFYFVVLMWYNRTVVICEFAACDITVYLLYLELWDCLPKKRIAWGPFIYALQRRSDQEFLCLCLFTHAPHRRMSAPDVFLNVGDSLNSLQDLFDYFCIRLHHQKILNIYISLVSRGHPLTVLHTVSVDLLLHLNTTSLELHQHKGANGIIWVKKCSHLYSHPSHQEKKHPDKLRIALPIE